MRDIHDHDGGASLAHVPEDPQDTVWFGKNIVSTKRCGDNL
jgi:hypothetical protein